MSELATVLAKLSSFSTDELTTVQALCKVLLGERDKMKRQAVAMHGPKKKRPPAAARGPPKKKVDKSDRDIDGDQWIME